MPLGKDVAVICALVNDGPEPLHVLGLVGTLNDNVEKDKVMMNFTAVSVNETLATDSEATYSYRFHMPADTPQREFDVLFHVFYTVGENGVQQHRTFYNQTVDMYESEEVDWHAYGTAVRNVGLFAAVIGTAVGLYFYARDEESAKTGGAPVRVGRAAGSSAKNRGRKGKKPASSGGKRR